MLEFNVYPGGKRKIVTFSYDDAPGEDRRLVGIFNDAKVKGTFHLISKKFDGFDSAQLAELTELYRGHEISCHTVQHGHPSWMPPVSVTRETLENRLRLEQIAGYPVRGMSYPYGNYNDAVVAAMRSCGIVYSRTTQSTRSFLLPDDFMRWHPTCHHRDGLAASELFMKQIDEPDRGSLLYIWGHAFEFPRDNNWDLMEQILEQVAGSEKIWYASNIEIYDYCMAQRALQISADERILHNSSAIPIWVCADKKEILCVPAGQTLRR